MRAEKIIWLFLVLLLVVISSVQAVTVFSWTGAVNPVESKSEGPFTEIGAIQVPILMFGQGLVIPFSPTRSVLQDHGGDQIMGVTEW